MNMTGMIILEGYRWRDTYNVYDDGTVYLRHEWLPPGAGMWRHEGIHLSGPEAWELAELILHARDQQPGEGHAWQEPEVEG